MDEEFASFIKARDPSILAWNRPRLNPEIRMDLASKFTDVSSTFSSLKSDIPEEESDHLEVYLRIKPTHNINELYDFNENTLTCHVPMGSQVLRNIQQGSKVTKQFSFSKIYGPDVNQTEIFNDCIKRKVLGFINGRNSTIFTYGATGSGKTYTILGTPEQPGIIPRSLEYLFRTIPPVSEHPKVKPTQYGDITVLNSTDCSNEQKARNKILNASSTSVERSYINTYKMMQQRLSTEPIAILADSTDVSVGVWVSFAEVYNEYVYDLLQSEPARGKQRPKLRLAQDRKGNTIIKDLTNISVCSGLEAYEILQYGMHNLNYAPTSMNLHSSRSHCIFTIKLVQVSSDSKAQISYFNFCDLAGSERAKSTRNVGDRLKESNNINTSLHVLGRCIKSIREAQQKNDSKLVPFRDSKLTRLFQRALSGQEALAMVVNINASRDMFDESQHVLNFSAIAKDISIEKIQKNEHISVNKRFSHYIQSRSTALPNIIASEQSEVDILRDQVLTLSLELEQQQQLFAEKESTIRREIVSAFQERNKEMINNWKARMEEEKQGLIDSYNLRIKNLIDFYDNEKQSEAKRARISSVIELDSTMNDEIEDLREELKAKKNEIEKLQNCLNDYQKRNSTLQAEKSQIEFQLSAQNSIIENDRKKIQEISSDLLKLKNKNFKLEQVITDAEKEVVETLNEKKEIEKQLEEKILEVIQLKEELNNLQGVNSYYTKHVEQLEEKLENFEDGHSMDENKENLKLNV